MCVGFVQKSTNSSRAPPCTVARIFLISSRLWGAESTSIGYPETALADADRALEDAREISRAATLFFGLSGGVWTHLSCGNYAAANAQIDELAALADEKGASFWKATAMLCSILRRLRRSQLRQRLFAAGRLAA